MRPNPQFPADLLTTFTEEILNEKLHFSCSLASPFFFIRLSKDPAKDK